MDRIEKLLRTKTLRIIGILYVATVFLAMASVFIVMPTGALTGGDQDGMLIGVACDFIYITLPLVVSIIALCIYVVVANILEVLGEDKK